MEEDDNEDESGDEDHSDGKYRPFSNCFLKACWSIIASSNTFYSPTSKTLFEHR